MALFSLPVSLPVHFVVHITESLLRISAHDTRFETGLFLADWGASVTRIDKLDQATQPDLLARGKRSIAVNLKIREGVQLAKKLIAEADVLIDPFRHGVLERLGLGPDIFLGKNGLNRKLVYTRIVG